MSPHGWICITLAVIVLATALQIAGLMAPCWIWLKTSDFHVGVGLYFRIGCEASSGNNCTHAAFPASLPFGYNTDSTYDKLEWEAVVWLQTAAAVLALVLCVMMMVYLVGFGAWRRMGTLNMCMTVVSALTWIIIIAGIVVFFVFYGKVFTRSPDVSAQSFPWSLLMVFIAAVLFIIITILIQQRCKVRNYLHNAIPTSADSKMALNPSTKNQVMRRYFTPSPYREARREVIMGSDYATVSTTNQSRVMMPTQQLNNLGKTSLEQTTLARQQGNWQPNAMNGRLLETTHMAAGVSGGGASPPSSPLAFGKKTFTTGLSHTVHQQQSVTMQQHGHSSQTALVRRSRQSFDDTDIDNADPDMIFYRGNGTVSPVNFSFVPGITTFQSQNGLKDQGYYNEGFISEDVVRQQENNFGATQQAARHVVSPPGSLKVMSERPRSVSPSSFRVGVEHQIGDPFSEQITTHMRSKTQHGPDRLLAGTHLSSGEGFAYNGTYVYRPYSEQSY